MKFSLRRMRLKVRLFLIAIVSAGISMARGAEPHRSEPRIKLDRLENKLVVRAQSSGSTNWFDLATYVAELGRRPYLHPVCDASGRQVLTEDRPKDHPWQHGIFTGFHRVNGFNYWKEDEGRQRLVEIREVKEEAEFVGWTAIVELAAPGGEAVLEEENIIVVHAPTATNSYTIDFTLVLRAKEKEVQFGKFFVGGLSIRMPWDKENPRQTHLNSTGLRGRAAEQQRAAWCMVERPFGKDIFGFAIFDHPRNPNHPPAWRVDEQGLINPNISGLSDWSIPPGESRQFKYQILVYQGAATQAELAAHFAILQP